MQLSFGQSKLLFVINNYQNEWPAIPITDQNNGLLVVEQWKDT